MSRRLRTTSYVGDPRVKPPYGSVRVNREHTQSSNLIHSWILNEGGGNAENLAAIPPITVKTVGTPTWTPGAKGLGIKYNGSADGSSVPLNLSAYNKLSIEFLALWDIFANDDDFIGEFTANSNTTSGGFYLDPNFSGGGGGTAGEFGVGVNVGGGVVVNSFVRPTAGVFHHYVVTLDISASASLFLTAYVDGAPQEIHGVLSITAGTFANDTLHLFSRNDASLFGAGQLVKLAIYGGRLLLQGDAFTLSNQPYIYLSPIIRRRYFFFTAAGNIFTQEHIGRGIGRGVFVGR